MNTTRDLTVTRVFDAPLEQVWQAWSDPEQVKRWWGPTGFTSPIARMDFRESGTSLVSMRSPDGHDLYNTWTYRTIVPMQRIEFILNFTDQDGNKLDPAAIGMPPGIPFDVRHVITFRVLSDHQTEMTVTEYGYTSDQVVDISKMGLEQSLDKMAASLTQKAVDVELTPQLLVMLLRMATQMRTDMMNDLTDAELAVRVPGNPTLGELCREMGNVERFYLDSFKTGRFTMDNREDETPETAASVERLKAWYTALDDEFEAVLTAIPKSEFAAMMVERSGRSMPAWMHYHTYHEAILIFCAKCSVYLRMMGKPLNDQWIDWIG